MEENKEQPQVHPDPGTAPDPNRKDVPRKILESLEKEPDPAAPAAAAEKVVPPSPAENPEVNDPGEETLIPKSMQTLEQVLKSIKEKAKES